MKSLQEIRIDVVRMGKEIRVPESFEEQFRKLCDFLKTSFGCPDFTIEEYELDKIDNSRFECDILKCAICKAFGISIYSGANNPWFDTFSILRIEDSGSYHGSGSYKIVTKYEIRFSDVIGYKIYNLLNLSEEQLEFIKTFKDKYQILRENLIKIRDNCFPIVVEE